MWSEESIIGFDTETTGIRPKKDRLVTCSIVLVSPEGVDKHYWLADPGVEIPERASAIHGITTAQARSQGRPIGEVLEEIATTLAEHMAAGRPAVAFNATYDFTLLEAELGRHGLQPLVERLGGEVFPVVDPYLLDRSVDRYRKGKRRLEDLWRPGRRRLPQRRGGRSGHAACPGGDSARPPRTRRGGPGGGPDARMRHPRRVDAVVQEEGRGKGTGLHRLLRVADRRLTGRDPIRTGRADGSPRPPARAGRPLRPIRLIRCRLSALPTGAVYGPARDVRPPPSQRPE